MAKDDRIRETIERLKALALDGGSHENLSAICSALMGRLDYGWTIGACASLREVLIDTLEQLDPDEWADSYLDEVGLMRLPKDADGEVIRIGDELTNPHHAGSFTVEAIGGNGSVPHVVYFRCNDGTLGFHYTTQCHHYHELTVEELLDEMYSVLDDSRIPNGSESRSYDEIISEYADRIRELIGND